MSGGATPSVITDFSGNGNDFSVVNAAATTYIASTINSLPGFRATGAGGWNSANFFPTTGVTVALVGVTPSTSAGHGLWSMSGTTNDGGWANFPGLGFFDAFGRADRPNVGAASDPTAPFIYSVSALPGGWWRAYINGTQVYEDLGYAAADFPVNLRLAVNLIASAPFSQASTDYLCEFRAYNTAYDPTEMAALVATLKAKYGIT